MDISAIISSTKIAIDIAKILKDSNDSLNNAERKLKLAELITALADVKIEAAEIKSVILSKDEEIGELKKSLKVKENILYDYAYYWLVDNDEKDGPFCQKCYDSNQQLIRLQGGKNDRWDCENCDKVFYGKNYVQPNYNSIQQSIF